MTRERAIQIMSNYDLNFHEMNGKLFDYGEVAEAFDMAIKSLKQQTVFDKIIAEIEKEINSPNRGTCDYFIVDRIEEIINKYKEESEKVK